MSSSGFARFERLAESYLDDADRRAAVTEAMRAVVLEKFTYAGLVDYLLSFIAHDLGQSRKTQEERLPRSKAESSK